MNTRLIVAALLGSIASFLLGWLVFGYLLDSYYRSNAVHYHGLYRLHDDLRISGIYLAQLTTSTLIAFIFQKWAKIHTFGSGFVGGLIIGLLTTATFDLQVWSNMNLYPVKVYVVDCAVNGLFLGVIGGIIALILGWKKAGSA